jgi:RTX calcium-binding nonapeptide repeat (4 copies)
LVAEEMNATAVPPAERDGMKLEPLPLSRASEVEPRADVLSGGDGADLLLALDEVSGNDTLDGGPDSDRCWMDPGDSVTSCP